MKDILKRYWEIFGGVITGLLFAFLADWKLDKIQLIYSIIILILVSIGVFKIIKQTVDKNRSKRKENVIDSLVNTQKPVKAISLATNPTNEGEKLGKLILETMKGLKMIMKKVKVFYDKFKGFILTIALGILTLIEYLGGYINDIFDNNLTINGVDILPVITLVCAIIVGCVSNGFTKEQRDKIKALFSKSSTNELVQAEIRKTLKETNAKLMQFNKILVTKQTDLENLDAQLEGAKNTLAAKQEMFNMVPQLATSEDIQLASNAVSDIKAQIGVKVQEIDETNHTINNLQTTIDALKKQL